MVYHPPPPHFLWRASMATFDVAPRPGRLASTDASTFFCAVGARPAVSAPPCGARARAGAAHPAVLFGVSVHHLSAGGLSTAAQGELPRLVVNCDALG